MTAEKFIDNPFGEGKLYKTGDLAYWREDGNIVYVDYDRSSWRYMNYERNLPKEDLSIREPSGYFVRKSESILRRIPALI